MGLGERDKIYIFYYTYFIKKKLRNTLKMLNFKRKFSFFYIAEIIKTNS